MHSILVQILLQQNIATLNYSRKAVAGGDRNSNSNCNVGPNSARLELQPPQPMSG